MPNIHNRDFSGGWNPSADPSNSPPNLFPRADNLDLEEVGILSLRQGSETLGTADGLDITSLHSVELAGDQRILMGGNDSVFEIVNGVLAGLGITTDGEDDTAFDSVDGHALIAAGTVKQKWDGTTVRNWGLARPLEAPEVAGYPLRARTIANFSQASAEFTAQSGTISYTTGQDGVANAALNLVAPASGYAEITYNFAAVTNLLNFLGAEGGDFDLFEFWFWDLQPTLFKQLTVVFGTDPSTDHFEENGYFYEFGSGLDPIGLTQKEIQQAKAAAVAKDDAPEPEGEIPPDDPRFPGSDRREDIEDKKDRRRKE